MVIRHIETGTPEYDEMVQLRLEVLLNPIGVPPSYINPEKEKNDTLIGAFEDGRLLGCCMLTHRDPEQLQLRQMAVRTETQRKGVGASLLAYCEKLGRQKGYKKLMMHARDAVMDFYTKCGYRVAGDQFFEVNIPHHVMEKEL
jgi:predicted GNAT family N-acyltransferase